MSYDIFFQGFIAGESSGRGGAQMREVVAPHVMTQKGSLLHVRFGDGEADLYLSDDGMVANRVPDVIRGNCSSLEPRPPTGSFFPWIVRSA